MPDPIPTFELPPAGTPGSTPLRGLIEAGWERGLVDGTIAYDPVKSEVFESGSFRFYHLPGRESRPRTPIDPAAPAGLRRPHLPCPFDAPEFLAAREIARAGRGARNYHLANNRYPVLRHHGLAIRPASDPPETLPQRLSSPEEIEDLVRLAGLLGNPFHLVFNSNRGADGSRSGSSVNHWHCQTFPWSWGAAGLPPRVEGSLPGGVEIGAVPGWPARHRFYRGRDGAPLAAALWRDVAAIDRLDSAYNVEVAPLPTGETAILLFRRSPTGGRALPGGGELSGDFGGFELTGGVVLPDHAAFAWARAHPREAERMVRERLEEGTAPIPG